MNDTNNNFVVTASFDDRASEGVKRLAAELSALVKAGASLSEVDSAMGETAKSASSFAEAYSESIASMSNEVNHSLSALVGGGYLQLAKAVSTLGDSGKNAAAVFGKAMLELSARAVLAIGQQAAVKAVFALAEGLLFKDPTALKAAALYGAVAAMAMGTGAALMNAANHVNTGASSGSSNGGRSPRSTASAGDSQAETPPGVVVNIRVEGHVVDTRAFVEEHVVPAVAEAVGRGVASRGQYNLVVSRD